jgi:uncharacterized OsmC-like protein
VSDGTIKAAVAGAVEYLSAHPAEARYRDGAARAVLGRGLLVEVTGPAGETVSTDMPTSIGGAASAASPGWLLRAAVASCVATVIAMRAAMLDVVIESLEVSVDSESDDRGILGIDAATPAGPLSAKVHVRLAASSADNDQLQAIVAWGTEHCPALDALVRSVPTEVRLES